MKFLCLPCDRVMDFEERSLPGDGTLAAVFRCRTCDHEIAMLTNPMETQMVSSLGVKVGGREVPEQPMELLRSSVADGRPDAFDDLDSDDLDPDDLDPDDLDSDDLDPDRLPDPSDDSRDPAPPGSADRAAPASAPARVVWTEAALERLGHVPSFVRGMVKRIYTDYARERGIGEITPTVMDTARSELGLEEM